MDNITQLSLDFNSPKLCECGCGQPAPIARQSWTKYGWIKGQPLRFCNGHKFGGGFTPEQRFWRKVKKTDTCWLWTGTLSNLGYGQFYPSGKPMLAHRYSFEHFKGPVPEDLELDHLCSTRNCVNPEHLEPVTHQENCLRAYRRRKQALDK